MNPQARSGAGRLDEVNDNLRYLARQIRRHCVANLCILFRPVTFKKIVVRKGLKTCSFPDRKAPALRWIGVDVIVPVFGYVRDHSRGWIIG